MNIIEQFIKERCNGASKYALRGFGHYLYVNGYEIVKKEEKKHTDGICQACRPSFPETPVKKECKHSDNGSGRCKWCEYCLMNHPYCPKPTPKTPAKKKHVNNMTDPCPACSPETPTLLENLADPHWTGNDPEIIKATNKINQLVDCVNYLLKAKNNQPLICQKKN